MKKVILMKGIPGSGKSFLANQLNGLVLSTDDLWMDRNEHSYLWDPEGLKIAHELNKIKFRVACKRGHPLIIVDNTNITQWERQPYIDIAEENGYAVEILEPKTDWRYDADVCYEKCSHGVPLCVIQKMLGKME